MLRLSPFWGTALAAGYKCMWRCHPLREYANTRILYDPQGSKQAQEAASSHLKFCHTHCCMLHENVTCLRGAAPGEAGADASPASTPAAAGASMPPDASDESLHVSESFERLDPGVVRIVERKVFFSFDARRGVEGATTDSKSNCARRAAISEARRWASTLEVLRREFERN